MGLLQSAASDLRTYIAQNQSPILAGYPLVGRFEEISVIVLAYFIFSTYGQKFMAARKPFSLKSLINYYNLFMIFVNAYIVYELVITSLTKNWLCEKPDHNITPSNTRQARAIYLYYLTKIIELMDTAFFIAKKKFTHVSFLHVYHHGSMCLYLWYICTFIVNGNVFTSILFNAVVHVIMYTYYFVASLGPEYAKYIWWKRHLTKIQIIQFLAIMFVACSALYIDCCPEYWRFVYATFTYILSFLVLFLHFYVTRYSMKEKPISKSD